MHFIVQKNINEKDYDSFVAAIKDLGHTVESFYHIPFDTSYPELPNDSNIFVYAASSVTDAIYKEHTEFKGVFNHTTHINIHNFYKTTPGLMWSSRVFQGLLKDVIKLSDEKDHAIFVRPAIDNKLFAGQVCMLSAFINMANNMIIADPDYANEEIFIGGVNSPEEEYRLFVVNGEVVASSLYRYNGIVQPMEGSPFKVKILAELFYNKNRDILPKSCVIDIGISENKMGVIEVNCINNSGFYDIIKHDLIRALAPQLTS